MRNTLHVKQCKYKKQDCDNLLYPMVTNVVKQINNIIPKRPETPPLASDLHAMLRKYDADRTETLSKYIDDLKEIAPLIKHSKFDQEKEWRYIENCDITNDKIKFRACKRYVVPYIEVDINLEEIASIAIGPTPDVNLAINSVLSIIHKYKLHTDIKIIDDVIPLSSWS